MTDARGRTIRGVAVRASSATWEGANGNQPAALHNMVRTAQSGYLLQDPRWRDLVNPGASSAQEVLLNCFKGIFVVAQKKRGNPP